MHSEEPHGQFVNVAEEEQGEEEEFLASEVNLVNDLQVFEAALNARAYSEAGSLNSFL
jgi:hypothetical protein